MQLIQLPWLPSTEVTKTARHYGYRLSGLALTVMLLSACNSEDGFSSDDSYNLTVDGETALIVAQTGQLHAVASHSDSNDIDVTDKITWTSSSPSVVSIDEEGHYKALEVGSAVLEGVYQGEVVETKEVEVVDSYSITFPVTAATAIDVDIEHNNDAMVVDWGDGSSCDLDDITEINDCSVHDYTSPYTGNVTLRAPTVPSLNTLIYHGPFNFDLSYLIQVAPKLKHIEAYNLDQNSLLHGHLSNLPRGLVSAKLSNSSSSDSLSYFNGTESDLPSTLELLEVGNKGGSGGSVSINLSNLGVITPNLKSLFIGASSVDDNVVGDLQDLQLFPELNKLVFYTDISGVTGDLISIEDLHYLKTFSLIPKGTKPIITGNFGSLPSNLNHIKAKGVAGFEYIGQLQRTEPFEVLQVTESASFDFDSEKFPVVDGEELVIEGNLTGELSLPSQTLPTWAFHLDARGAGDFNVDLEQFTDTVVVGGLLERFLLSTDGSIEGDLSDLNFKSHRVTLDSEHGEITGNIANFPSCQLAKAEECWLSITTPNNVTGDIREYLNSRLVQHLGSISIAIREGGVIELTDSASLDNVGKIVLLGDGISQSSVNNIMIGLDKNGMSDGEVTLSDSTNTNNPPPTGSGLLAAQSLEAKGWDVCYTGKPGC